MSAAPCSVDHLVIGSGPAGSMVALRLAAAGRQVLLLEKQSGPHHKVCGEFLSPEAVGYLHQAGVAPRELGAAVIRNLRLSVGGNVIETPLPFQALSLSRRVLDAALLSRAEEKGCQVLRGIAVESLTPHGSHWTVTLSNGESLRASTVFLATGKHDLRGFVRAPATAAPELLYPGTTEAKRHFPSGAPGGGSSSPGWKLMSPFTELKGAHKLWNRSKQADLIGFKLHWQLAPAQIRALREVTDLYLFPGGYGGLSLVENGIANLCLVVRRSSLRTLGGWPQLLATILRGNHHLRQLLEGGAPLWARPLAISPIPYGYLIRQSRGLWCVGDQAAVIPSFTGDGISIALHSAALAAQMFLAGQSIAGYNRTLRAQLSRAMALAAWLSRAAVTPAGRTTALAALPFFPGALRWIAASTRIPQSSLVFGESALAGARSAIQ